MVEELLSICGCVEKDFSVCIGVKNAEINAEILKKGGASWSSPLWGGHET
jgi:hypothetical protein